MKLTKNDIKDMETVGTSEKGNEIVHVQTKGGLHLMVERSRGGAMDIIAQGPHRAVARSFAGKRRKIEWNEGLFKNEDKNNAQQHETHGQWSEKLKKDSSMLESSPDKHYALAKWNSKKAREYRPLLSPEQEKEMDSVEKHNRNMTYLHHTDNALSHYKASGMDHREAAEEHDNNIAMALSDPPTDKPPYDGHSLQSAYQRQTGNRFPSGIGYDYTK